LADWCSYILPILMKKNAIKGELKLNAMTNPTYFTAKILAS
jgi:hypothetical protein